MGNIRDRFHERLREAQAILEAATEDAPKQVERLDRVHQLYPDRRKLVDNGDFPRSLKSLHWILLSYYVLLLEAMIKEYARFFAVSGIRGQVGDRALNQDDDGIKWNCTMEDESLLPSDAWERWTKGKIREVRMDDLQEPIENAQLDEAKRLVLDTIASFSRRRLLLKAKVIRNLVLHNDGKMNQRNYKETPFREIGVEPEVSEELLKDLRMAMYLLNERLFRLAYHDLQA